ncbi:CAAX protease self-immunity [Alkalispirochaeta americana]|uniref:CAAX protease self-immunity n=2 Tax=Alkalispirochaeta americana TaxID=159291 RepID=A0A1N6WQN7_9SPIO|nr:CAAX protease self-immunity [Alkalispirochaeta americana]
MQRFREIFLLWAIVFLPGYFSAGSPGGASFLDSPQGLLAVAIKQTVFALLVIHLLDVQGEAEFLRSPWKVWSGKTLLGAGAIALSLLALAALLRALTVSSGQPFSPKSASSPLITAPLTTIPLLTGTLLAVAYGEEIFFRAYLLIRLNQAGLSSMPALLISATLFALTHQWQGPEAVFFAWISGIFLGSVWILRPGIHHLALGHAAYNALALLIPAIGTATV